MKPWSDIEKTHKPLLSEDRSQLIADLLSVQADVDFLIQLQDSRSTYKDLAIAWFLCICWTGIPAKAWANTYFEKGRPYCLCLPSRISEPLRFSLILFDDNHISHLSRLVDLFHLLGNEEFSRVFNECRQLYMRCSKMLWPDGTLSLGFRLAGDIFRYQVKTRQKPIKTANPALSSPRHEQLILLPRPPSHFGKNHNL